ncbi:MAG: TonB-dependent receptor [Bacteroidota bacterium]
MNKVIFSSLKSFFLVFLLYWGGGPATWAQTPDLEQRLSLQLKGQPLAEAFRQIEEQSEFRFTYNNNDLPEEPLRRNFRRKPLRVILQQLLDPAKLRYEQSGYYLIILPVEEPEAVAVPPPPPAYTISGYLLDSLTGEALIGGTVLVEESGQGVAANAYGFYSISLPKGDYHLQYRYIGFKTTRLPLQLEESQKIDVRLGLYEQDLPDVVVSSKTATEHVSSLRMGSSSLLAQEVRAMPALLGEPDVLRTIQLLPGVVAIGNGGFSVRGGKVDQNLVILDEAPIYNTDHLLGVMSVFNVDAIKNVELIKGGMPAEYRGRLSSVLNVRMKEGTTERKLSGKGGIGLLASRLMLEGRLFGDKGSFMVSARRTYLDILIGLFANDVLNTNFFSDYNLKANYRLGPSDRLFFSAYSGKDEYGFNNIAGLEWGNRTATLRWNRLFSDKLFMNTSLVFSNFRFRSGTEFNLDEDGDVELTNLSIETLVRDVHLNTRFQYYLKPELLLKFGGGVIHHRFIPAAIFDQGSQLVDGVTRNTLEIGAYCSAEHQLNERLNVEYGVHISDFVVLGAGDYFFDYNDAGEKVDSTFYDKGEVVKNYFGIEPRFLSTYQFDNRQSIKFSYTRTYQYLQRLNSAFVNNPATVWLPSSRNIRPQNADQVSLGYFRNLADNRIEFSVELYYKQMNRQIEYRDGAQLGLTPRNIEALLVYGQTKSRGVEVSLRKKEGRFWGWLSYTFSRSKNNFLGINDGKAYDSDVDIPVNINVVGVWNISKKCTLAANWIFRSGRSVTVPAGKFQIGDQPIDFYTDRNNYRFPSIHRLDLSLTLKRKGWKKRASSWNFAIQNVYLRQNPLFVFYDTNNENNDGAISQVTVVRIIPSVAYNFEF